jgi:hypothetical protein
VSITKDRMERRQFLRRSIAAAGTVAALPAFNGLGLLGLNGVAHARHGRDGGYGPLAPVADLRDGAERLALPRGFQYRSFSLSGTPMSDGNPVPLALDGMGVFNMRDGTHRLVRNHEDRNDPGEGSLAFDSRGYDEMGGAGTTTLVIDPETRELVRDFISLSGTIVNCAGGVTPWDSWITCEETNEGEPQGWSKQHGYCFDVPADANGPVRAVVLPEMGRFSHEAVAVDPSTGIVYETEDNGSTSGFYRFIPNRYGDLERGGKLEMLKIADVDNYDTGTGQTVGVPLPVEWVPIADPDPPGTSSTAVFNQGFDLGAASFRRLEGCWFGNGAVYFAATSGGDAGVGQVWEYRPGRDRGRGSSHSGGRGRGNDGGFLTLVYESPDAAELNFPDNLTVSPQGSILLCEDAPGFNQFMRGVTRRGEIFDFGLNLETNREWAGATFAEAHPSWNRRGRHHGGGRGNSRWDRVTLFVNRQGPTSGPAVPSPGDEGMTFAIWGPWGKGAL